MQADFVAIEDFLANLAHLNSFVCITQSKEGECVLAIIDIIVNEFLKELRKVIEKICGNMRKLCPYCLKVLSFYFETSIFTLIIIFHHFLVYADNQILQLFVKLYDIGILLAGLLIFRFKFIEVLLILILQNLLHDSLLQILQIFDVHLTAWLLPQLNGLKKIISFD